jgi:molybdate transport system substrate-binding protein
MALTSRFFAAIAFVCLLIFTDAVQAAELKVLCANGMQTVMEDLGPKFERATGHKLAIAFDTGGATIKRARVERADVVIAIHEGVAALAKDGRVASDTATTIASTGISIAVRTGSTKPDIASAEALKRTLLSAKSITYLNPADGGASGIHFAKVLDRLGLLNEMKSKTIYAAKASAVGPMVANGDAELGILQYQLLYGIPGIDIVGPLPADLQSTTTFSVAMMATSSNAEAAKDFIRFLRTQEAAALIKAKGMDPVSR